MIDREKVIKGLKLCATGSECTGRDCPYWHNVLDDAIKGCDCTTELVRDALAMLKEQEAKKFLVDETGKITPLPVVVRCKDCVFGKREKNDSTGMTWIYCGHHRENRPEDWFCASGSRI